MFPSFNARALGLTLSPEETLRLASENGFGGVDLMVRDLVEQRVDLQAMKARMDDLGLRPGAFPMPIDWRTSDEAQFRVDLKCLSVYAEAAACLGLCRTGTWVTPDCRTLPAKPTPYPDSSLTFAFHSWRLHMIAVTLQEFGIRLGLEVIGVESSRGQGGTPFIHRLDQLETLRESVELCGSVEVGVVLDSWHLYAAEEPLPHALAWPGSQVVWVHVADLPKGDLPDRSLMIDSVRGLPGEHGAIESHALLQALEDRGYDGPVTAEPLARCRALDGLSPDDVARAAARSLRAVWPGVADSFT